MGTDGTPRAGEPVRWRSETETVWDPATGGWSGRSHHEWFDRQGRRLGEEWRRWHARAPVGRSPGASHTGSGPPRRPEASRQADRLADRLMLAGGAVILAVALALRALSR